MDYMDAAVCEEASHQLSDISTKAIGEAAGSREDSLVQSAALKRKRSWSGSAESEECGSKKKLPKN